MTTPKKAGTTLPNKETELLKKIAEHEAYGALYKLKLASVVVSKGAVFTGKAVGKIAKASGQIIQKQWANHQEKKKKSDW